MSLESTSEKVENMETSREIKFRAWDKFGDNGSPCMRSWEQLQNHIYFHAGHSIFTDSMLNLMQYTGLKDKQGKEIYEGDIVRGPSYNGSIRDGVIRYESNAFIAIPVGRFAEGYSDQFHIMEVIGNIYENPELIDSPLSSTPQSKD